MIMEAPNMGPEWVWKAGFIAAIVGVISAIIWIIKGIVWLFNHVQIT